MSFSRPTLLAAGLLTLLILMATLNAPSPAHAQLSPIDSFVGTTSETWESFPNYSVGGGVNDLPNPSDIMGGFAAISTTAPGGMIVYEPAIATAFFGLGTSGDAKASDGVKGMGIDDEGTTTIVFDSPVTDFGAFWGAATGSGFPDPANVTLSFFDAATALIGTENFNYSRSTTGDGLLEWHGYHSTIGIKSLSYTGIFVVTDGLQANVSAATASAPEPASLALLALSGLPVAAMVIRRRRSA
jgi:hypothetical protein